ncbi:MAG: DsbE family thiol:disulfide interchange protein [Hyphomicrobiaceae bacterium]
MQRLVSLVPVLVFAAVSTALGFSLTGDPRRMPSMLIDKPTPEFALAPLGVEGAAGLTTADLAGKVSLLNVFASWCPGCLVEHPTLMRLARAGAVPMFGVNWKDKPGDGKRWLDKHGSPYLHAGDDRTGRLGIDLGVTGVPETFVVDRTGRIRYRHAGPITDDVWRDIFAPLVSSLRREQ